MVKMIFIQSRLAIAHFSTSGFELGVKIFTDEFVRDGMIARVVYTIIHCAHENVRYIMRTYGFV